MADEHRRLHVTPSTERREHAEGSRVSVEAALNKRALALAKAHHAEMGTAMRLVSGKADFVVAGWDTMAPDTREVLVEVMRGLLDKGVIV